MECTIASDLVIDLKDLHETPKDDWIDGPIIQTTIPDVQYYISIFPNNSEYESDERKVAFYLFVKSKMPITGEYTFSIPSAKFSQTLTYSFEVDEEVGHGHGEHAFSRNSFFDPLNGYFRLGKLTLQLRGTLKCDKLSTIKYGNSIGESFFEKDDKDFTIEVDGGAKIKAHKFILRERSPYFAAMFDSGMKESIENKVKIEGFPFKVVETAIKICYDCKPNCFLFSDDLLPMLKFSDVYGIAVVKTFAEFMLSDYIHPSNVCKFANASIEYNAENLRLSCINGLIKYSKTAVAVPDFDSLDVNFKADFASKVICHETVAE